MPIHFGKTVSFGVVNCWADDDVDSVSRGDSALYAAKAAGRSQPSELEIQP